MALEGNLSSFGLSEILQLISVQQKTGMLTVGNDSTNAVMFFCEGQLVSTRDRRRKARDPFKEYLTRYGMLSRDELIRISQIGTQSKLDFVDIIASEGFLSEGELEKHWRKQIQEAMHDVLTWDQCAYKFISNQEIVAGIKTLGEFSVEAMLMESMRRIDEFPHMLTMFPHDTLLVTRLEGEIDEEKMTQNEKDILALLTDILSLRDLIARGKMPLFEVYEVLKLLKGKDLIKVKDKVPEDEDDISTAQRASGRKKVGNLLPFVVATAALAAAISFGFKDAAKYISPSARHGVAILEDKDLARARFEYSLRAHIEAFYANHGEYPQQLSELYDTHIVPQSIIKEAEAYEFRYRLTPDRPTYTLL